MRTFIISFFLIVSTLSASATHLMSGSMGYEYIGKVNGKFRYRILVQMFRDCKSSIATFDSEISIGIYTNGFTKPLLSVLTMPLVSEISTNNLYPCLCAKNADNICSRTGTYTATFDFDSGSTNAYHLYYQRCCRNIQVNLYDDEGMSLYAFIGDIAIGNNSTLMTNNPVLGFCTKDTVDIQLAMQDRDKDSFVCNMMAPTNGGNYSDPNPVPPKYLLLPLDQCAYKAGYSSQKSFGPNGYASFDSTLMLKILAYSAGRYSIAMETKEYRAGQLISIIYTQFQVIAYNCSDQSGPSKGCSPPIYISNGTTIPSSVVANDYYEMTAGDSLCFNVMYRDSSGYDLDISINQFNGQLSTASLTELKTKDTATSIFCWRTNAQAWQGSPYTLMMQAEKCSCCQTKEAFARIVINVNAPLAVKTLTADGNTLKAYFRSGQLVVENPDNGKGQLQLFDIAGKSVLNQQLQLGPMSYDLQHLSSGIYLLTTDKGTVVKLVKAE